MTAPSPDPQAPKRTPSPSRRAAAAAASGLRGAVVITVVATIVFAVTTYELVRGELSTTVAEIAAAVALLSFGVGVYGLLRMILSLIESAGERRRRDRERTERRKAEREGTPPVS